MFKYFVGQIYLLEEPPEDSDIQLEIEFPDSILGGIDEAEYKDSLSIEQVAKIKEFRERMTALVGADAFARLYKGAGVFQSSDSDLVMKIAESMDVNRNAWNGLAFLNSPNSKDWDDILYLLINLRPAIWDVKHKTFVRFVKVLSKNWTSSLPELIADLAPDVDVDLFFKLERNVSFKLAALLHDVNEIQKEMFRSGVDVSPFIRRLAHAFLPSVVYQLEEYGLPRMISRKIHRSGLFNFEEESHDIHTALDNIRQVGRRPLLELSSLSNFERDIVEHFFDGIEPSGRSRRITQVEPK